MPDEANRRVLLTGAAGRIGTAFREYVGDRYVMRLAAHHPEKIEDSGGHEVIPLEVADLEACRRACEGMQTVVHLAANPSPSADFYDSLLDTNIKGVYNILRAAKDAGCERVVVASSVQAVTGYPLDEQVHTWSAPRPLNMYGVGKAFAEACAHYFAATEGLSTIAVRIGSFEAEWVEKDPNARNLSTFISRRDMSELLIRCVEQPDIQFAVVHGVSDNRYKFLDMTDTKRVLNYRPVDDAFRFFETGLTYSKRWYQPSPSDPFVRERPEDEASE